MDLSRLTSCLWSGDAQVMWATKWAPQKSSASDTGESESQYK